MSWFAMWAGFIEPGHLVDGVGDMCGFVILHTEARLLVSLGNFESPWGEIPLKTRRGHLVSFG